jgi:hypothetical protein
MTLCCRPTADQRPSEHRPTDDEDNRSGQVDPAETHRLAHEQDDQESEDSDTDDRCQRPSLVVG